LPVRELLTREDFWDIVLAGEGVIVVVDKYAGSTAHPASCPGIQSEHFMEKVIKNNRKNGSYYAASSSAEAKRELNADPCHCS
jgi:hypothetical protein